MIDKNYKLRVIEKIGEGGNGVVMKYFDENKWKPYALKILVITD